MKCPLCARAELVRDTRDLTYCYEDQTTTIPAVAGEYCPACSERILDASEAARVSAAMLAFRRAND